MDRELRQGYTSGGSEYSPGTSELANSAVSALLTRQAVTKSGARQFVFDHLLRAVQHTGPFDARAIFDELRGHRLQPDAIIDIYVPEVARSLGELWSEDEINFATVTIGAVRLQSLLNEAVGNATFFERSYENAPFLLIVLPAGEQHTLGGFVLAAQLRRCGARVEISFGEPDTDLAARLISDVPDAVLYSISTSAGLEKASRSVLDISRVMSHPPRVCFGGSLFSMDKNLGNIGAAHVITGGAREIMDFVLREMHSNASVVDI